MLENDVTRVLIKSQKTLAIAESCTGGLLTHRLTNIPGSSRFLKGTVVAYSNTAKSKILNVSSAMMKKYGAVSEPVARAMAQGACKIFGADLSIAITGIAGPTGGTKAKPVGLVFIAAHTPDGTLCLECYFKGSRGRVKSQAADQALKLLVELLK
ncbi:MAG: CinA family protein [Candidatus Omnitrophota bacterium]|nr:CinA family protein [Candidatus Omnitrophota bacterium]